MRSGLQGIAGLLKHLRSPRKSVITQEIFKNNSSFQGFFTDVIKSEETTQNPDIFRSSPLSCKVKYSLPSKLRTTSESSLDQNFRQYITPTNTQKRSFASKAGSENALDPKDLDPLAKLLKVLSVCASEDPEGYANPQEISEISIRVQEVALHQIKQEGETDIGEYFSVTNELTDLLAKEVCSDNTDNRYFSELSEKVINIVKSNIVHDDRYLKNINNAFENNNSKEVQKLSSEKDTSTHFFLKYNNQNAIHAIETAEKYYTGIFIAENQNNKEEVSKLIKNKSCNVAVSFANAIITGLRDNNLKHALEIIYDNNEIFDEEEQGDLLGLSADGVKQLAKFTDKNLPIEQILFENEEARKPFEGIYNLFNSHFQKHNSDIQLCESKHDEFQQLVQTSLDRKQQRQSLSR